MEPQQEEDSDNPTVGFTDEDAQTSHVFSQLQAYCLDLLELSKNSSKHSSSVSSLLQYLQNAPSQSLQPFFDYTLFPLLLLLDAAVDNRSSVKESLMNKVSDRVAEDVFKCLVELLSKCQLGSVDQIVAVLKKLTYAALLSPSEASEEFLEGVIKCFRAMLLILHPCLDSFCSCKQVLGLPELLEHRNLRAPVTGASVSGECLVAFLQSQKASAAVGKWLSLLLKAADAEAARGHQGSGKLCTEAFLTLWVLVAKAILQY